MAGGDVTLGTAIARTIAYADVFDFPLTESEVFRYLIGVPAAMQDVSAALRGDHVVAAHVTAYGGFFFLKGREEIVTIRRQRGVTAAGLWRRAASYGRVLARLPFVRMVAVTGALAVDNPGSRSDIDYLIVTEPGRLWSARAHAIAIVRLVAPLGDVICPNYFLSERVLELEERDLFIAHELAQMVPLSGLDVYWQLRRVNDWTAAFLPNASGPPRTLGASARAPGDRVQVMAERLGRTRLGSWFERWEMQRKVDRFTARSAAAREARFSPDICKGHMSGHGRLTLDRFAERLQRLGLA